jgi:hypothetical protein
MATHTPPHPLAAGTSGVKDRRPGIYRVSACARQCGGGNEARKLTGAAAGTSNWQGQEKFRKLRHVVTHPCSQELGTLLSTCPHIISVPPPTLGNTKEAPAAEYKRSWKQRAEWGDGIT